jgi:hypothetical protein
VSKTLRQLRIRYEPFGVHRQLSEHRLAYLLWRYLGRHRGFRARTPLRASAKSQRFTVGGMRASNARLRRWEPDEDKQLREMVEAGKSITMMALRLKRTEMAVRGRLGTLKVSLQKVRRRPGS